MLPGAEFRVAYDEAMKYGGKVVLGDRPVQVKFIRISINCSAPHPILWRKGNKIIVKDYYDMILPFTEPDYFAKDMGKNATLA